VLSTHGPITTVAVVSNDNRTRPITRYRNPRFRARALVNWTAIFAVAGSIMPQAWSAEVASQPYRDPGSATR
jgi:hypothetical protein